MTTFSRFILITICAGALASMLTPAAHAAPEVVATAPPGLVWLDAHEDTVAWSTRQAPGASYGITVWQAGTTRALAVPARRSAYDVDVGPRTDGSNVAVYSRCRREGRGLAPQSNLRGCDVFLYDLSRNRERRLRSASSRRYEEALPSLWRDRVAFARRVQVDGRAQYRLLVRSLSGKTRGRAIRGGSDSSPGALGSRPRQPFPAALQLRGDRLLFSWVGIETPDCPAPSPKFAIGGERSEVWSARVSDGSRRREEAVCAGQSPGYLDDAAFDASAPAYLGIYQSAPSYRIRRIDAAGRVHEAALEGTVLDVAVANGAVFYARRLDDDRIEIVRESMPAFQLTPRQR